MQIPESDNARLRLLNAARELFCREGIHATGIANVLSRANVARRTLYVQYGSKENLLRAVFERESRMWMDWFDVDLPKLKGDPHVQLLGLFDLLYQWFGSRDFYGCIFINATVEHDKVSSWVTPLVQEHLSKVQQRILVLTKLLGSPSPAQLAAELALLIDGAIVTAMTVRTPEAARTAQRIASHLIAKKA